MTPRGTLACLQFYGVHPGNVLDYFSLSIFYDRNCNNEAAKLKGIPLTQLPWVTRGGLRRLAFVCMRVRGAA
jgi:hypothetical protein